jgi:acrylyl-CoA reductase (NADPH)
MIAVPASFPAFLVSNKPGGGDEKLAVREIGELAATDLPPGEITVRVEWSGVNYKDALACTPGGGVARISPLVPGVDVAGEVVAVEGSTDFKVGDLVIAHGHDIGTGRHGAYAAYCRLAADTVVPLPAGLSLRQAMAIGTAGFTAAQSVQALQRHGITKESGPVLVTGATGGVGSAAVSILAQLGYEVVASTGKATEHDFLKSLGAAEVIDRSETSAESARPLEKERWGAAVDCVGGSTLAFILRTMRHSGAVAASGLTGGAGLTTTVLPFILRNVALLGIDSVMIDMKLRREIWQRCATDLRPKGIDDTLVTEIGLAGLDAALTTVKAGGARGRYLVRVAS